MVRWDGESDDCRGGAEFVVMVVVARGDGVVREWVMTVVGGWREGERYKGKDEWWGTC